ncbi:MAG: YgiQ family radical SAM protein [Eubacteriaceae bacterium]|jgi:uncharacterized radical SAM protein YgiQ|nr:YgiQ family radical SAM protein [Eubacteriaceae bacterium]
MYRRSNKPLPSSKTEQDQKMLKRPDFVLITGDGYIDHPSYGAAVISRVLDDAGYSVAIISQPDWTDRQSVCMYGKPKLGFLITSGNMDSMVSNYTVNRRRRRKDYYTPGGKTGKRPDRAVIVYSGLVKENYPDSPIIIGGIETSLRRFAHYDYWDDSIRRPILYDCRGDLLVFGMGEKAVVEIAEALKAGISVKDLTYIRGTGYLSAEGYQDVEELPSFEEVSQSKRKYAQMAAMLQTANDPFYEKPYIQKCQHRWMVQNPPQLPLTKAELDKVYALPYSFKPAPHYREEIPSYPELKFSMTINRGCIGNCSFCAIALHQGRYIQSRSVESVVEEAKLLCAEKDFKGYIHDVGGPTANFLEPSCEKQKIQGVCRDRECLFPKPCPNLKVDHSYYLKILSALEDLPKVKKVFIRSGIRYDYVLLDQDPTFLNRLVRHHVSGQLHVAPEHVSDSVLRLMGKPPIGVYNQFKNKFDQINQETGKKQYIIPYFISGHPGSTLEDAIALSLYLKKNRMIPKQVQDFYPTPGTLATAMYYTGLDPNTLKPVYVAKGKEKQWQRACIQFNNPRNYATILQALKKAGREDLIGRGVNALIPPYSRRKSPKNKRGRKKK